MSTSNGIEKECRSLIFTLDISSWIIFEYFLISSLWTSNINSSWICNNIFGRRSHITGINDKNFNIRNFQERAAINAPIQGSAAEIMRLAMIRISKRIEEAKEKKCKMLLQIHDELIFEVPKESEKKFTNLIRQEMTSVKDSDLHSFSTPLTVDVNSGENWGLLH